MKTLLLAALGLTLSIQAGAAIPTAMKAKLYDFDQKNVLYNYDHKLDIQGERKIATNTFTAPDGSTVAVEKVVFDGKKLVSYEISHKQLGADGKIEVAGDKINFSYARDGKTKTDSEDLEGNFVVGPSVVPFMRENWAALTSGKEIDVRLGVADRLDTVGFTLKKVEEKDYNGQKAVVIRMKPTSFVIAAIVKPVLFTMSADSDRLLELRGRVVPKKKEGSSWKDLDAVTVYEYN